MEISGVVAWEATTVGTWRSGGDREQEGEHVYVAWGTTTVVAWRGQASPLHYRKVGPVILSEDLARASLATTLQKGQPCHPERSEGSPLNQRKILRCAQDDRV